MSNRDLSLRERTEEVREKQSVVHIISFSLDQIKDHFEKSVSSIEDQYEIADSLSLEGKQSACEDIWRSQVVFAESALDFYIHELSKYAVMQVFKGNWPKSDKYRKFLVPMESIEEGINHPESNGWLEDFLNQRFSREVYLSLEQMREQMNLLGLNFTDILAFAFPKTGEPGTVQRTGQDVVRNLFSRRNQIAHQSDRMHANAEKNSISKEYVQQCLADVRAIVEAMHSKALEKDSAT